MYTISPTQLDGLARHHMLRRVHRLLKERSPDAGLQALLASPDACYDFWHPHYDALNSALAPIDEHALAVRLAYLLAARAHAMDPQLAYAGGGDDVVALKARLDERGVLAFSAFDD